MLSKRENLLETIRGGHPDRLVKQFEGTAMLPGDPVNFYVRGDRHPGMEPKYDLWGSRILWPAGEPGAIPDSNYKVITDVASWRDFVKVPDLIANCSDEALWEPYLERAAKIDRNEDLLMMFAPTGIFERFHFLMGFEDTLCNFLLEPEAMADLAMAIGEYRYNGYKLMVENVHPDALLSHDDWGSKSSLFVPPDSWREIMLPAYRKGYDYLFEHGVIIIHHADSFCEPIVEDMVDIGIDVWQGVLPTNDIVKLTRQLDGRMALMGGIDSVIDREDATEEEIRTEVRRCLKEYGELGHFIPSHTYGGPGTIYPHVEPIIFDEIDKYNRERFGL